MRRFAYVPLALLVLAGNTGCLYIPPLSHASGRGTVQTLNAKEETRQTLREKLGAPDVVDLPSLQVWEWRQNRGHLILIGPGAVGGGQFQGDFFGVLARYDGDQVKVLETTMEPTKEAAALDPPFPEPAARFQLEGAGKNPYFHKSWVAPGGKVYAASSAGDLWSREDDEPKVTRVADINSLFQGEDKSLWHFDGTLFPGGRRLALSIPGEVIVWDGVEQKVVARLPLRKTAGDGRRLEFRDTSTALSPDGKCLAMLSSGWKHSGRLFKLATPWCSLKVIDTENWNPLWEAETEEPKAVQFSPDGRRLLAAGRLYETVTGRVVSSVPKSKAHFYGGGQRMAFLEADLQLCEVSSGRLLGSLTLQARPAGSSGPKPGWFPFSARVLPDDTLLAAGRGILLRCDLRSVEQSFSAVRPAGEMPPTLSGASGLEVRLLPRRRRLAHAVYEEPPSEYQISPGGNYLLEWASSNEHERMTLRVLDLWTLRPLWVLPPRPYWSYPSGKWAWSPGEVQFTEDGKLFLRLGSELRFWNLPKQGQGQAGD